MQKYKFPGIYMKKPLIMIQKVGTNLVYQIPEKNELPEKNKILK